MARPLKRVFDIDMQGGGELKSIAAILERPLVIEKILTHLGLDP